MVTHELAVPPSILVSEDQDCSWVSPWRLIVSIPTSISHEEKVRANFRKLRISGQEPRKKWIRLKRNEKSQSGTERHGGSEQLT